MSSHTNVRHDLQYYIWSIGLILFSSEPDQGYEFCLLIHINCHHHTVTIRCQELSKKALVVMILWKQFVFMTGRLLYFSIIQTHVDYSKKFQKRINKEFSKI